MPQVQTKSGRNLRCYFNGTQVGLARQKTMKFDKSNPLEQVVEMGNPDTVEYVQKASQTTYTIDYMMLSPGQLAIAQGQTYGSATTNANAPNGRIGEVPNLPSSIDIVARLIQPGTEHTASEVVVAYSLYQQIQIEKESYDQEADKIVGINLSGKGKAPRHYEGVNGIQFDRFTANGSTTAFVLTKVVIPGADGFKTARCDINNGNQSLREGFDYTATTSGSTTTVTIPTAPGVGEVVVIYAF